MQSARVYQVFIAHPSDTSEETQACLRGIADANALLRAFQSPIYIEAKDWGAVRPGFHSEGGQGQIEEVLPLEKFDLVIGILRHRLGTLLSGEETGTQREIRRARELFEVQRSPRVQVYFSTEPLADHSVQALDQLRNLQQFKSEVQRLGLSCSYSNPDGLRDLVREFVLQELAAETRPYGTPPLAVTALPIEAPVVRASGTSELLPDLTIRVSGVRVDPTIQDSTFSLQLFLGTNATGHCGPEMIKHDVLARLFSPIDSHSRTEVLLPCYQLGMNGMEVRRLPIVEAPGEETAISLSGMRANASQLGVSSTLVPSRIMAFYRLLKGEKRREIQYLGPSCELANLELEAKFSQPTNAMIPGEVKRHLATLADELPAGWFDPGLEVRVLVVCFEAMIDRTFTTEAEETPLWMQWHSHPVSEARQFRSEKRFQATRARLRLSQLPPKSRVLFLSTGLLIHPLNTNPATHSLASPGPIRCLRLVRSSSYGEFTPASIREDEPWLEIAPSSGSAAVEWEAWGTRVPRGGRVYFFSLIAAPECELDSSLYIAGSLAPTTSVFTASHSACSPTFVDNPQSVIVQHISQLPPLTELQR